MLVKTSIAVSIFSLVLFSGLAITGVKGPDFSSPMRAGATGGGVGRGAGGGNWIWFGGK